MAQRILTALGQPLTVLGSEIAVQASIGIALGSGGQSTSEILRSADLAMYRAKADGKSRYALYEPSMHEHVLERLALKADLQRSIIAEEFELYYQPIVALQSSAIVGIEGPLRWRHPQRGLMLPDEFVPLAEETGLILPLGRFVLQTACREVRRLREVGHLELGVSVNISAKQLASQHLPAEVTAALTESSLEPSALTLEITESMLLDSQAVVARLEALKQLGVRIAIDDFGTGYSSLNYLRRPRRRDQDCQGLRRGARIEPRTGAPGVCDPPARRDSRPGCGSRGDRRGVAARPVAQAQVPVRPGLLLLAAASGVELESALRRKLVA